MPEPRLALTGPVLALSECDGGGGNSPLADLPGILVDATKADETAMGAAVAVRKVVEMVGIAPEASQWSTHEEIRRGRSSG